MISLWCEMGVPPRDPPISIDSIPPKPTSSNRKFRSDDFEKKNLIFFRFLSWFWNVRWKQNQEFRPEAQKRKASSHFSVRVSDCSDFSGCHDYFEEVMIKVDIFWKQSIYPPEVFSRPWTVTWTQKRKVFVNNFRWFFPENLVPISKLPPRGRGGNSHIFSWKHPEVRLKKKITQKLTFAYFSDELKTPTSPSKQENWNHQLVQVNKKHILILNTIHLDPVRVCHHYFVGTHRKNMRIRLTGVQNLGELDLGLLLELLTKLAPDVMNLHEEEQDWFLLVEFSWGNKNAFRWLKTIF